VGGRLLPNADLQADDDGDGRPDGRHVGLAGAAGLELEPDGIVHVRTTGAEDIAWVSRLWGGRSM